MGIYAETVCCCKYSPFNASSVQKESCFFCPAIIKTFYILTEEAKGTAALSSHAKSYEMTVKGNPLKSLVRPRCLLTDRFLLISIHCTPARFQHFEPSNSSLFSLSFFFLPSSSCCRSVSGHIHKVTWHLSGLNCLSEGCHTTCALSFPHCDSERWGRCDRALTTRLCTVNFYMPLPGG